MGMDGREVVHAFFIFYQVSASSHTLLITSIYFIV